jgi:hypothetical protein
LLDSSAGWSWKLASAVVKESRTYFHTFFLNSIIDIHYRRAELSIGLSILVFPEPLLCLILEVLAEGLICVSTGIKARLKVIPPLEERRNCDWILEPCQNGKQIRQTNPDKLLPIGVIDMSI